MNHPTDDELLLAAYGETPDAERPAALRHLQGCAACRARFRSLEESRAALDWGLEGRRAARSRRLVRVALQLAAAVAVVLLVRMVHRPPATAHAPWRPHLVASPYAGYVTGGAAFITIDSQLTRLEKGRVYGTLQD